MRRAAKITISLPLDVLEAITARQKQHDESRSEAIVDLIRIALTSESERAEVERYIKGYREYPETDEEVELSDRLAQEAARSDPWP
jgi:metal-responsive CopG/Arc/MetJ family transcriptional regulator